jgi:hypothetical protein
MKYAARLRTTRRNHAAFLATHHRRAAYYARHIADAAVSAESDQVAGAVV